MSKEMTLDQVRITHWTGPAGTQALIVSSRTATAFKTHLIPQETKKGPCPGALAQVFKDGDFNPSAIPLGWTAHVVPSDFATEALMEKIQKEGWPRH